MNHKQLLRSLLAAVAAGVAAGAIANEAGTQAWQSTDTPGDGRVVVTVAVNDDPDGCQIQASTQAGCDRLLCKGEGNLLFNDRAGMNAARKDAELRAKAHMAKFLNETVASKETMQSLDQAIKKDGGDKPGTERVMGRSIQTEITNSARAMLKGVVTVESGVDAKDGFAYVVVGASCKSQAFADQMAAGNRTDTAANGRQASNGTRTDAAMNMPAATTTVQRSKGANNF